MDLANYKITHTTTYSYTETVPVCQNIVHLTPRNGPYQKVLSHKLQIRPHPTTLTRRLDYFGNHVHQFSLIEGLAKLAVKATTRVELRAPRLPPPATTLPWDTLRDELAADFSGRGLDARQFVQESTHVPLLPQLGDYARESFAPGRPIAEAGLELMKRIRKDFRTDPTATTIYTPLEEVFAKRRGVCQDFAHVMIGALRALGLPARYVSGYIRTYPPEGKPRLVGADASHAWLALYCGPAGWLDLDPTNDLVPKVEHVTVAWGRDFSDVSPIFGMFVGGGSNTLNVGVEVEPIEQ
jgi:transglutaminase-like putative cysteine protease